MSMWKLWKSTQVWFTCLVNTQAQARNNFLTYTGDFSEKYYIILLKSLRFFHLLLSLLFHFSLFQIQFCLYKSVTYYSRYQNGWTKTYRAVQPPSPMQCHSLPGSLRDIVFANICL